MLLYFYYFYYFLLCIYIFLIIILFYLFFLGRGEGRWGPFFMIYFLNFVFNYYIFFFWRGGGGQGEGLKQKQFARLSNEVNTKMQLPTKHRACGIFTILKYVNNFVKHKPYNSYFELCSK